MKTLLRIFILALLMTDSLAFADKQSVPLRVLQKGTGDPVEGATVVNLQTNDYVTTDSSGQASLSIAPGTKVKILAPGYEPLVTKLKLVNGEAKYYLEPISVEDSGMEVVAERLPEKISKIALSSEELAHAPGSQGDPLVAVQSLPGIVAVDDSGGQVYMRGSDANDNIAVVNRLPIGYLYHFGGLRSTINPQLISDLNIFLGGFPVNYGDALGGVFDVRLRDPSNRKRRYFFDISTIESSFVVEGPVSQANPTDSFYLAARRSYFDLLLSPSDFTDLTSNGTKPKEETNQFISVPRYYDVQGVYHHPTHNGSLDYYYFAAGDETDLENREGVKADPQAAGEVLQKQSFQTLGMSWKAALNNQWHVDMPLVLHYQSQDLKFGTDDAGNPFYANSEQINLSWLPELTWKYNERDELMYGLETTYVSVPLDLYISRPPLEEDTEFLITDLPKYRVKDTIHARSLAPYVQQRKHWNNKVTTIAGLRYSYVAGTGGIHASDASPRLAVEYQATPLTLYTASWGRYLQLPLGFEILEGFGNPSLSFTEAEHRIIGVEHKINKLWSAKAEAYQKPFKDLVVPVDSATPPDNYKNLGTGEAYGLDIFLRRERSNGRMGWLSYSYARTMRYNPLKPATGDRNFSGDQPHTLTYVWSQPFRDGPFKWMKNWKRWTWGIKFQAHSGKTYTPLLGVDTSTTNPDGSTRYIPIYDVHQNSARTPTYYRLDLRLERDILRNESKMKFYVDILNVTNHKNIVNYDYGERYEKLNNPDEITGTPFFPYVGFEMEF
jgi:hypothetical protein